MAETDFGTSLAIIAPQLFK
jgi:hypothetical protein